MLIENVYVFVVGADAVDIDQEVTLVRTLYLTGTLGRVCFAREGMATWLQSV